MVVVVVKLVIGQWTMGSYRQNYICVDEFEWKCSQQTPYEGYVEGLGYAFFTTDSVWEKRKTYGEPEGYYANIIREQKLEVSLDTISNSRTTATPADSNNGSHAGRIMNVALALSGALLADDITGIGVADDIAIPFILAGGAIIASIVLIYEKSVGKGNSSYPGPWCETQPDPARFRWEYRPNPVPEPPFDQDPVPNNNWRWAPFASAILIQQLIEGSRPSYIRSVDTLRSDSLNRIPEFRPAIEPNLKKIVELNERIEHIVKEQPEIKQDNTRVVKYPPIHDIER